MYTMVLMAALATGEATPDWGWRGGCHGGCYGACYGGCYGGWGACYGCYGYSGGWGNGHGGGWGNGSGCYGGMYGQYGCYSCNGGAWGGGWQGPAPYYTYGCYGVFGCHGCYGCYGCYGCTGYMPVYPTFGTPSPTMPPADEGMAAPRNNGGTGDKKGDTGDKKGDTGDKTGPPMARAQLIIELPADAKLYIDNNLMKTTSAKRVFNTPNLPRGQLFYYVLRAEVVRDGKTLQDTKRVLVRAGQEVRASFDEPAMAVAANSRDR
jgi:uncharacterized protein (TIGR03000 family)